MSETQALGESVAGKGGERELDGSEHSLNDASDGEPDARLSSFYNQGDAADASLPIPPKPSRPDAAVDDAVAAADAYPPGTTVVVTDLETGVERNSAHGKVIAYDPPTGRYIVELTGARSNHSSEPVRLSLQPEKVARIEPISINTAPLVTTSTLPESGRREAVAADAAVPHAPLDVVRVGQDRGQQIILSHCASVFSRDAWCDTPSLLTCLVRVQSGRQPVHPRTRLPPFHWPHANPPCPTPPTTPTTHPNTTSLTTVPAPSAGGS